MFRIVALFDVKANCYHSPFAVSTAITAVREFRNVIYKQEKSVITDYPEEFELRDVGYFDETSGELNQTKVETLETGKNVVELIKKAKEKTDGNVKA